MFTFSSNVKLTRRRVQDFNKWVFEKKISLREVASIEPSQNKFLSREGHVRFILVLSNVYVREFRIKETSGTCRD